MGVERTPMGWIRKGGIKKGFQTATLENLPTNILLKDGQKYA